MLEIFITLSADPVKHTSKLDSSTKSESVYITEFRKFCRCFYGGQGNLLSIIQASLKLSIHVITHLPVVIINQKFLKSVLLDGALECSLGGVNSKNIKSSFKL